MTVLMLRHGQAEPRGPGIADSERKLTRKGVRDVRRVMEVARKAGVRITAVLRSPLRRAVDTAAIAVKAFDPEIDVIETTSLLPDAATALTIKELQAYASKDCLLLVGHEPHLSALAADLLGCSDLRIRLKKAALLRIDVRVGKGALEGELHWILNPRLVRSVRAARPKKMTD